MKIPLRSALFMSALLVAPGLAHAVPSNDDCAGAVQVFDGDNAVSNVGATQSVTVPCPVGGSINSGFDTWYYYVAPATGVRNFAVGIMTRTDNRPVGNPLLTIYDACGGSILACDDNGGELSRTSKIYHLPVTAGSTYIIRFANSGSSTLTVQQGTATLTISDPPTPQPLDDCGAATPVAGQVTVPFSTAGLTNYDNHSWDCEPMRSDGWFAWTPSATGIALVDACGASLLNPNVSDLMYLGIYTSCDQPPLICSTGPQYIDPLSTCPDTATPRVCFDVIAGQTYLVRFGVDADGQTATGDLHFDVRPYAAGISIPADAVQEPGSCSDDHASDLNGGCTDTSFNVTHADLCTPYTGTSSARLLPLIQSQSISLPDFLSDDADWYEFTLDTDQAVTIVGESEFFMNARVMFSCPSAQIVGQPTGTPNCLGLYTINLTTPLLVAGTYDFVISPVNNNTSSISGNAENSCGHRDRYWFKISGSTPCPATGACCTGTTCSITTQAACGSNTYKGDNSTCTATTCCPADFDQSGSVNVSDIFAFLRAWFAHNPSADIDANGSVNVSDIFAFLRHWFGHC